MYNYKRVFLVDTLNIEDYSFVKLMNICEDDLVYLFKTESSKKIDLNEMESIIQSNCKIQYIDLKTNNYINMSMVISFNIGKLFTSFNSDCEIFIVSDTTNFEYLINLIDIPNKLIHLNKKELDNIREEIFYTEDEEVSIFPAFNEVSNLFKKVSDANVSEDTAEVSEENVENCEVVGN